MRSVSCAHFLAMQKIILASGSAWRKQILERMGVPCIVDAGDYEEDMTLEMPPEKLAAHLALGKAKNVAMRHRTGLVLGADTFAVYKRHLLGKPHTAKRATEVLTMLSGKWHDVYTGHAMVDAATGKVKTLTVHTRVHFRKLSREEIAAYVKTGIPLKAGGSYTAQSNAAMSFIDRIEGDFWSVVGLSPAAVMKLLKS